MSIGGINWNKQNSKQLAKGEKLLAGWLKDIKKASAWLKKQNTPEAKLALEQMEFWKDEIERDLDKIAFRSSGFEGAALR